MAETETSPLDTLTIAQAREAVQRGKEVEAFLQGNRAAQKCAPNTATENGMIGKYVIVRCTSAGVHSGYLESCLDRSCVLTQSRRLWRWRVPKGKSDFLSGVALYGIADDCKIGEAVPRIHLTENCEIIEASEDARKSIEGFPVCIRAN